MLVDELGNAVLVDFGYSRVRYDESRAYTTSLAGGKLRFLAPEITAGDVQVSENTDIYSLAMVIYELLYQTVPFSHIQGEWGVIAAAQKGHRPARAQLSPRRSSLLAWANIEKALWLILPGIWGEVSKRAELLFLEVSVSCSLSFAYHKHSKPNG